MKLIGIITGEVIKREIVSNKEDYNREEDNAKIRV